MRELDDAEFERELREVLSERLGSLPLDLTIEALERRRVLRDRTRRRRRTMLLLGLAAALILPVGWLAAGAPVPRPNDATVVMDQSSQAPGPEPTTLESIPPQPTASDPPDPTPGAAIGEADLLIETGKVKNAAPCDDLDRHDTRTGASIRLLTCADRIAISPDATKAAVGGPDGLAIVDLQDGTQIDFIELGEPAFPIVWSPRGQWLQWAACGSEADFSDPCKISIGANDGTHRTRLPGGKGGGFFIARWLPDESHVLLPKGGTEGWLIGDGDGSGLEPLADDSVLASFLRSGAGNDSPAAVSPDGTQYAYASGPYADGRTTVVDLWLAALDGGAPRNLTRFEPGAAVRGAAWSPDGRTIAIIKGLPDADGRIPPSAQDDGELWLIGLDGSERQLTMPDGISWPFSGSVPITWSPDISRLAVEVASRADAAGPVTSIDTIIVPIDGSAPVVLRDARRPQWSPAGGSIALVSTTGSLERRENDPVPPATIDVAGADGSDRHIVAAPTGDPDRIWFTWVAP